MYLIFFVNCAMAYRYSRGSESFGNMRLMIECQSIYDDGPQSSATFNHLNQLNHEQELEISQEEVAGSLETGQEKGIRIVDQEYSSCPNIDVAEFLSFFNPYPMIDSEPPPKIPQRQAEERSSFVEQLEIASNDESGATTIFHSLSVEESISPESPTIQQQNQAHSQNQNKDKSYNKNLACYISRSVRRLIFGKFQHSTIKHCQRRGISYERFQLFCQDRKFRGINSIRSFYTLTGSITDNKMGELFRHLYQKILRRSYIRTVVEEGKMTNIEAYIDYKNKYLLNLA